MLKIYDDHYKTLRMKSVDVNLPLSKEEEDLAFAMLENLKASQNPELAKKYHLREGVGLAAPQVGVTKKIIAVYFRDGKSEVTHLLANPKIISESARKAYVDGGEGCLSVNREVKGLVFRAYQIKVKAYDIIKKENTLIKAKGFEAIVLQHEIDHLNAILFYDRISPFITEQTYPDAVKI